MWIIQDLYLINRNSVCVEKSKTWKQNNNMEATSPQSYVTCSLVFHILWSCHIRSATYIKVVSKLIRYDIFLVCILVLHTLNLLQQGFNRKLTSSWLGKTNSTLWLPKTRHHWLTASSCFFWAQVTFNQFQSNHKIFKDIIWQ